MEESTSVFDDIKPVERYGNIGILAIAYILLVNLLIFFFGGIFILESLSDSMRDGDHHPFVGVGIGFYVVVAFIVGLVVKGKKGIILSASVTYIPIGIILVQLWPNFPIGPIIAAIVFAISLALMQTHYFKRFYKVERADLLIRENIIALLIGGFLSALFPYARGW